MKMLSVLIIGGDAAGMSAAHKARRTNPALKITVLEMGDYTSYSACGLPYLLSGVVSEVNDLIARTPEQHIAQGVDLRLRHEAMRIEPRHRRVIARTPNGEEAFPYDRLILATGASPRQPPFCRDDLDGMFLLRHIPDALEIRQFIERHSPKTAVIIGGGYIGMEMVEALSLLGISVTLVEHGSHLVKSFDPDMSDLLRVYLDGKGVRLLFDREVVALNGIGRVRGVTFADGSEVSAEMVLVGTGVVANSELAADAGIAVGEHKAIVVDNAQRTNQFHIYAAGDCAAARHLVLNRNVHIPLGTTANKQGRVAGENAAGGHATFGGIVGTAVCKVFDWGFARTGLTEQQALRNGFAAKSVKVAAPSRSSYYLNPPDIHVKLTYDTKSRRLLGGQLIGDETVAKRVDVVAAALHNRMTVDDFAQLDLSYAPPYSPVWDPLLVAANAAAQ